MLRLLVISSFSFFVNIICYGSGVWINEFHYDNNGADTNEFVEVAGPAGTDLTGWEIRMYNGSNGGLISPIISLSGTIDDEGAGFGALSFAQSGIQNGPDGFALVDPMDNVIEFISYEGSFTATAGPANGMTSIDIGVSEPTTTPLGNSLQRIGSGSCAADFTWTGPVAESPGSINTNQILCPDLSGTPTPITFNITQSTCESFGGTHSGGVIDTSGNMCPSGSSIQFSVNDGAFSTNLPVYNQSTSEKIEATCFCQGSTTTTSDTIMTTTLPGSCPSCPSFVELPPAAVFDITESTCTVFGNDPMGGVIDTTTTSCPNGSTIHFSLDDGPFTDTLPAYVQNTNVKVEATCICNADATMTGDTSVANTSVGSCPICPTLTGIASPITLNIVNSECAVFGGINTGGSIDTTANTNNCPNGSTIHFSLNDGPFTDTLPAYNQNSNVKVEATCICDAQTTSTSDTIAMNTVVGTCPICPDFSGITTPISISITNSTCSILGDTPSGGIIDTSANTNNCPAGSKIHFSLNDGPFTDTIPAYNQNSNVKVEATCICDAQTTSTSDTIAMNTVLGTCPNSTTFSLRDPCNCENPRNCDHTSGYFFNETIVLPASGSIASGLDIRVTASSGFFIDVPCIGTLTEPTYGAAGTAFTEIGTSGVYFLEFWKLSGATPSLSVSVAGNTIVVPSSSFSPACNQTQCASEPIPTMNEWALINLCLLFLILGIVGLKSKSHTQSFF